MEGDVFRYRWVVDPDAAVAKAHRLRAEAEQIRTQARATRARARELQRKYRSLVMSAEGTSPIHAAGEAARLGPARRADRASRRLAAVPS